MTDPGTALQKDTGPSASSRSPTEPDLLARFVYVESEDNDDDALHEHSAGCVCHLRGV